MRNWIHALTLVLALSAAFPSAASTISIAGADGPLAPATDYTLPYRADGIFDFSTIDLGTGTTLRFDPLMQNVRLLSLGNVVIAGGIDLALKTPGQTLVTGLISAGSLSLSTNTVPPAGAITLTPDALYLPPVGNITILGPGTITLAVPEPATPWLVVTLLPLLIRLGRRRTSHGC